MLREIFEVCWWIMESYRTSFYMASMNLQGTLDEKVFHVFNFMLDVFESGDMTWLSLTAVGLVSAGPTSVASQIRSLVTGLKAQYVNMRNHFCYADGKIDSAVAAFTEVLGDPAWDEIVERDNSGEKVYSWVAIDFFNVVSICIETYPYNAEYRVKILDHTGLAKMLARYFEDSEKVAFAAHQNVSHEEYGVSTEDQDRYNAEMAWVIDGLEDVQSIKDWSESVPYGHQSYKLESHYDAVLAELEIQESDRYCIHSTTLAPYASIVENVQDAETEKQIQLTWTTVDTTSDAHRWTYP